MGVIRKETILGEMLLFSFHPQLKAKNTLAHPALVPLLQPLLPSPLFPPALTLSSWESVPTGLPRGSGSAALPQTPHQLLFRGDSTLPLCIRAQQLTAFGVLSEHPH